MPRYYSVWRAMNAKLKRGDFILEVTKGAWEVFQVGEQQALGVSSLLLS